MSEVYDGLQTPYRRWALCLTVSGLDVRYYDVAAPPATTIHGTTQQYVDKPMLLDVSGVGDTYSVEGGVAEHSPHTVVLATRGRYAEDEYDPGVVFGRLTNRSAQFASRVTTSIPQTGWSGTIFVEDDPTSLSVPRLVHIDGESFWVTSTAGAPFRLLTGARAAARSPQQPHTVNETTQDFPELTTEVVHWRTRWATIHVAPVFDDGSTGEWAELTHGFIDTTPQVDSDGNTVTLQLAPLTALLDTELAPPQGNTTETTLAVGYHEFNWPEACTAEHMQWIRDRDFTFRIGGGAAPAGVIPYPNANAEAWNNAHDFTLGGGAATNQPRQGLLNAGVGAGVQSITGATVAGYNAPNMPALGYINFVHSAREAELYQKDLAPAFGSGSVLQWPEEAFGLINAAGTGWANTTLAGSTGSWLSVQLDASRSKIVCDKNFSDRYAAILNYSVLLWRDFNYFDGTDEPLNWRTSPQRTRERLVNRLHYPFAYPDGQSDELSSRLDFRVVGKSRDISIKYPSAFYQQGERYILTADDLTIPSSGVLNLRLKYRPVDITGAAGDEETVQFKAISSTAVTYGGSTIGYKLEIDPDDVGRVPSFGEWDGIDSPTLTAVATWDGASSAELMTELLTSSGGDGVNGFADVLPFGGGLPGSLNPSLNLWGAPEFVDLNSFYNYPAPAVAEDWTLFYEGGETLRDIIDAVGRATSTLIVMQRRADGTCRLRRVSIAASGEYEAVGSILEADWLADRIPTYGVDDRVFGRFVFKINHDDSGDPQQDVVVIDNRAIRTHGEAETYELDIRGLRLDDPSGLAPVLALRPLYSRLSRILSDERRVWRGSISSAQAVLMQLGAVYSITSRELRGYSDFLGVAGATARLKSLSFNFTTEGADVEFVFYDQNATGWNAAMEVIGISDATTVIVAANGFSGVNNPSSGSTQNDVDFFAVGDIVRVVPTANHDAFVTLTIDSIFPSGPNYEVEFSGAHGLTAPLYGTVEPTVYASASDLHKQLAYLADTTPSLGAGDPAQEFS